MLQTLSRIKRHLKLIHMAVLSNRGKAPPFMIIFVNSVCNLRCGHCFYWRNLNQKDDLTYSEFRKLSLELGPFENLNLSGGEPFLHKDLAKICKLFIRNNKIKLLYIPTNGYFTNSTEKHIETLLKEKSLQYLVCEISLDGMPEFHDHFRGKTGCFEKAMNTYQMLARLQKKDSRLRIHSISTATKGNLDELKALTKYLHDHCPAMDHHNIAIIRGDRKNRSLERPELNRYLDLYRYASNIWKDRQEGRFGAIVDPMLQWAKAVTIQRQDQVVPCTAGNMTGVVYANGDVSLCESHPPIGNLRKNSFFEIWNSSKASRQRAQIRSKQCHCTNEVFLWPSIVFQPIQLVRALAGIKSQNFACMRSSIEQK